MVRAVMTSLLLLRVRLGGEDAAAALGRSAAARIELLVLLGVIVGALVLVVVQQLLARLDASPRVDEDPLAVGDRLAVSVARVVEKARIVAVHGRVDHRLVVDGEQEGVMPAHLLVVVSLVRRAPADALTEILDE